MPPSVVTVLQNLTINKFWFEKRILFFIQVRKMNTMNQKKNPPTLFV